MALRVASGGGLRRTGVANAAAGRVLRVPGMHAQPWPYESEAGERAEGSGDRGGEP